MGVYSKKEYAVEEKCAASHPRAFYSHEYKNNARWLRESDSTQLIEPHEKPIKF
jgi:hypothetical protein